jgi:hypothetical protein
MTTTTYTLKAHLDAGHDMSLVQLTMVAQTVAQATIGFHEAMAQLGFKRSDYGAVHWLYVGKWIVA